MGKIQSSTPATTWGKIDCSWKIQTSNPNRKEGKLTQKILITLKTNAGSVKSDTAKIPGDRLEIFSQNNYYDAFDRLQIRVIQIDCVSPII
jgi:hypothetical protein